MKKTEHESSRRVTLRDIAQVTGYSVNTISHALKDKSDISQETKQLIKQKAMEMGYIVDSIAGSMRSGITRTIAVILGDIFNPHFGLNVREIERALFKFGYSTFIISTDEDERVERDAIITAISKRVDGIIICPTQKEDDNLELIRKAGIPYVLIGRRYNDPTIDYVVNDDVQGGYIAARYLLDNGYQRVLFLNGPGYISSSRERLEGYVAAHRDTGVPVDSALIHEVGIKSCECGQVLRQVIDQGITFSAVLGFSDLVALETLNGLRQIGGRYAQIPVVGFDDILSGLILPVSLTSVAPAEGSLATWVTEILMRRMEETYKHQKHSAPRQIVLKVKLFHHS